MRWVGVWRCRERERTHKHTHTHNPTDLKNIFAEMEIPKKSRREGNGINRRKTLFIPEGKTNELQQHHPAAAAAASWRDGKK